MRFVKNRNPLNGERLTQRQKKEDKRRVFYDFTCSAPKSVSVLAVTLDDERLVVAHEESARIAFRELDTFAATRVRKQGGQRDRTTGNLVAAAFTHTSSRALDPQFHTHFTVFNATFDDREQCWKALQAGAARKLFMNGDLVEVQAIQGDSIVLADGRVIPQSYRTFTHGYAVTWHAAQGKTVDEVLVVASSRSLSAVHQQQFYVSISRGRERCQVFTGFPPRLHRSA